MKITKCDACGNTIEDANPLLVNFVMFNQIDKEEVDFDICPGCWGKVVRLLAIVNPRHDNNEFRTLRDLIGQVKDDIEADEPS